MICQFVHHLLRPVADLFVSRCAYTLIRHSPRASPAYATTFPKTPIAYTRAVCASSTCGAPSGTLLRTTPALCLRLAFVRSGEGSRPDAAYLPESGGRYVQRALQPHRWYYLGGQTPDEVTLIKCFDSDESKARLTPHIAFLDSTSPKDAPNRQSIEMCCLVFDE